MFCISSQRSYEGKGFIQLLHAFYNSIVLFWSVCLFINCFLMISILLPRMQGFHIQYGRSHTDYEWNIHESASNKMLPTQALRVCRVCYLLPPSVPFSLIERLFLIRW